MCNGLIQIFPNITIRITSMSLIEQLDTTTLLVGAMLSLSLLWWLSTRRPAGLPPGPGPALPLLGHIHLMDKDPRVKFHKWRRQYGDIFSLYIGTRLVIVISGFPVIKEAFVKFADVFSERPHMFLMKKLRKAQVRVVNYKVGFILESGPEWEEHRKTTSEILRELGVGKNKMLTEKIQEEVVHFIRSMEKYQGAPMSLHKTITISVSNNICSIIFGKRFEYEDPIFTKCFKALDDITLGVAGSAIIHLFPFLEHIPGDIFGTKKVLSSAKFLREAFIQPQVDMHVTTFNEDEATDYIYAYLRQMKNRQRRGVYTYLSEQRLTSVIGELLSAATETTAAVIEWILLFFLHYPNIQEKCYQEICDVIGTNRLPSMRDRASMVFVEATINEVLRWLHVIPFALPHAARHDVNFQGYFIPKDAIILPFVDSVLREPKIWGDPENFRPERFIGPEGKLTKSDEFIPFGIGPRMCLGVAMAQTELYLYVSTLIQHFHFLPEEPDTLPPLKGTLGIIYTPLPYRIRAVRRE